MSPALRIFLFMSAVVVLLFVARQIKKSTFDTSDALYWLLLSSGLVLIGAFPNIAYCFSNLLGFQSPSNFVFLVAIGLLLIKEFKLQCDIIRLRRKLTSLTQEIALQDHDRMR